MGYVILSEFHVSTLMLIPLVKLKVSKTSTRMFDSFIIEKNLEVCDIHIEIERKI